MIITDKYQLVLVYQAAYLVLHVPFLIYSPQQPYKRHNYELFFSNRIKENSDIERRFSYLLCNNTV